MENTCFQNDKAIELKCGGLVYINQRFIDHMSGRHDDVYHEHLQEACSKINASHLNPGQSQNFEVDLLCTGMFGNSHLVPMEEISMNCTANFCVRNQGNRHPVRIAPEGTPGRPSANLKVFIVNKNGRLFIVTAYWFNPDIIIDRANPKFWAKYGVIYNSSYFFGQPFISSLKNIYL